MPDDVARLLSLNTGLILFVIAIIAVSTWGIVHEMRKIGDISERVAGIAECLDARLRRQYADIDRELSGYEGAFGRTINRGIGARECRYLRCREALSAIQDLQALLVSATPGRVAE